MQHYYFRHFEVADKENEKESSKIFSVPDFVGDACKAIASRVRGAVAGVQFDDFHKVSNLLSFISNYQGWGIDRPSTSTFLACTFACANFLREVQLYV